MKTNFLLCSSLALALAVCASFHTQSAEPMDGKGMMDGKMQEQCKTMMAAKQKMVEDVKAQDAELSAQIATMNSAPADKKLDLMAAAFTHMAEQRTAMNARKAKMEEEMMGHMMQHMQMGKESMSMCPMMKGMKGMKGMDEKAAAEHTEHHDENK